MTEIVLIELDSDCVLNVLPESPATSTLFLVLDRVNNSLGSPVKRGRNSRSVHTRSFDTISETRLSERSSRSLVEIKHNNNGECFLPLGSIGL